MIKFTAKTTKKNKEIIDNKDLLKNLGNLVGYPYNIIIPEEIENNINEFKTIFEKNNVNGKIFYAHKCNKSSAIVKECLKNNVNIDVSSFNELRDALSNGYVGEKILASGPKSKEFIWLALEHGVFISVDNYNELNQISELTNLNNKKAKLLFRINNAESNMVKKESRFGLDDSEFKKCLSLVSSNDKLELVGISMHFDTINIKEKVNGIAKCIRLINKLLEFGFNIRILDIGGGYKVNYIKNEEEYQESITKLKENVIDNKDELTWNNYSFGMRSENGTLKGVFNSYNYYDKQVKAEYLDAIFNSEINERKISDIVNDFGLELWIEPGRSLLDNVGLNVTKVNFVKEVNNKTLVGLEMKKSDLLMNEQEILVDPIVLNDNEVKGVFFVGNLCLESDFIYRRKVFVNKPEASDLVVFVNTAPYFMDFEQSNTIMHDVAKKVVVTTNQDKINYYLDDKYNPFIN